MNNAPNIQAAQTILEQLGGNRFKVMTGAKNFMGDSAAVNPSLSFRLPSNFASRGINYVKITLTQMDTYNMEFSRVRGTKCTLVDHFDNLYAEDLQRVFSIETGLGTRL